MPKKENVSTIAHVNPEQAIRAMKVCLKSAFYKTDEDDRPIPVLLVGPPGSAKSSLAKQLFRELAVETKGRFSYGPAKSLTSMRPEDWGVPDIDRSMKVLKRPVMDYILPSWLPLEGEIPEHHMVGMIFEEPDRASPDVQAPLLGLTFDGVVSGFRIDPKLFVVMCCNAGSDIYTHVMAKAQYNRICILHLKHEIASNGLDEAWDGWASERGVTVETRAFKAFRPHAPEYNEEEHSHRSDRSLVLADRLTRSMREAKFPTADIELPLIAGVLGYGQAVEYIQFHKRADEMPDIEKSLKDPEDCRIPGEDKPDVQAAFTFALASRQYKDAKTLDAAIMLMTRMTKPMCAMGFRAIAKPNPSCITRPVYQKWSSAHLQQIS